MIDEIRGDTIIEYKTSRKYPDIKLYMKTFGIKKAYIINFEGKIMKVLQK